jgi:hypothetical protein
MLVVLLALVAVEAGALPGPAPTSAPSEQLTVALTSPTSGETISGVHQVRATTSGGDGVVARVEFWTDGTLRSIDRRAPYMWKWNTSALSGAHLVSAVAYDGARNRAPTNNIRVSVVDSAAPTTTPTWASGFETGSFSEWNFRDDGPGGLWPDSPPIHIVDPTTEGVPYRQGTKVGRFEVSPTDRARGRLHAKLYKHFGPPMPTNVSGSYRASFYLPWDYSLPTYDIGDGTGAVTLFQWKEWANGGANQDPLWWLEIRPRKWMDERPDKTWVGLPPPNATDPVVFINHWQADNNRRHLQALAAPKGRWFDVRAELRQPDRIDFYVDGKLLGTALDSEYSVSPFHGDPNGFFIFGLGNYGTTGGVIYADDVSFAPAG